MEDTETASVAAPAVEPTQTLADWQRMHATLLEAEKELARMSEAFAAGHASAEELDALSAKVVALRELSLAVLARLRRT